MKHTRERIYGEVMHIFNSIEASEHKLTVCEDMVATEERKLDQRKKAVAKQEAEDKIHKDKEAKSKDSK